MSAGIQAVLNILREADVELLTYVLGQEKFRTVTASFYRDADVVLFCCAVDDRIHFTALDDWLEQYKRASSANASEVALQVGTQLALQIRTHLA